MPLISVTSSSSTPSAPGGGFGSSIPGASALKAAGISVPSLPGAASSASSNGVNLKVFRDKIGDFSRSYLFQISIPPIDDDSQSLTMLAESTILPSYKLEDKSFEFQGVKYKMAGNAAFDDWNVTFLCDEYHKVRHKFLAWQSLIYDPIRQIPYTSGSYKKNGIQVLQLSRDGDIVSGFEFFGLYPSQVGEVQLSHSNMDVGKFTVTFAYDYFIVNTEYSSGKSPEFAKLDATGYSYAKKSDESYATKVNDAKININDGLLKDKAGNPDKDYSGGSALSDAPKALSNALGGAGSALGNALKSAVSSVIPAIPGVTGGGDINKNPGLLKDKAGNADQDYNGRGNTLPSPLGFLQDQIKKLNPFGRNGDINTTDAWTFMDALNWMNFRYSPPLRYRSGSSNSINRRRAPNIKRPYDWLSTKK
jgi:hypothetical protein